ncbi:MAG: DUF1549 and DUF1553 domain-containing protein, partial [Planctomycetes bacterium]|nr:DUF1549 and DUF1553 domain-containing protein [Planctomycetota bacterium]
FRLEAARVNDSDWWSWRPLERPPTPQPDAADWIRTPVDAFILAKLHEQGLSPSPEADRRTLVRRLSFDLLGLPPSPAEIERFIADPDPLAYEKLVDRLLASPRYGERWARHWLDVVHYGETHGYDKDKPRLNAWPYRDYVIRALNEDKPYRRFVQEQVAGDVLWPETRDGIVATGFLAAGPWDFIGHVEVPESKYDGKVARNLDRDDVVTSTMNTFCSLTIQCARCHNHKLDAVTMRDYYRLQAVFAAIDRADRPFDADPEIARLRRELDDRVEQIEADAAAIELRIEDRKTPDLAQLEQEMARLQSTASAAGENLEPRSPASDELRERYEALFRETVGPELLAEREKAAAALAEAESQLDALPPPQLVYAGTVHEGSGNFRGRAGLGPREIFVLHRGDVTKPGEAVEPGVAPLIPGEPAVFELSPGAEEGHRRAALARWITHRDNPLTWRSIVNRVWHYHFGRGLVDTPNDFGRGGQLSTHPQLLDWLAVEFRDGGGSLKSLHRLICLSSVYRQTASPPIPHSAIRTPHSLDAENKYLWRMNRRRLEAEEIRDAVLLAAGRLDLAMGGPSFMDFIIEHPEHSPHYQYHLYDPRDPATDRRAVYRFLVRSQPQPFMNTLDCADPSMSAPKRDETLTSLQALAMLNNRFMLAMAEEFAARLKREAGTLEEQVVLGHRLATGRAPAPAEQDELTAYAREFGLANTCRVLLNLNEFVFVD